MKKGLLAFIVGLVFISINLQAAEQDKAILRQLSQKYYQKYSRMKTEAEKKAREKGWPIRSESQDGQISEIMGLEKNGMPIYYITQNLNSAKTIDTDHVWNGGVAGLDLSGDGFLIGEWDGGLVRSTHQEFDDGQGGSRVTQRDAGNMSFHSTFVSGTIIAGGVNNTAKGMAYEADLDSYDWDDDLSEMALAAANDDLILSNHSYGKVRGWSLAWNNNWYWYGDVNISATEDYLFGFYDEYPHDLDELAYNLPQYLIVKSAGNDRQDACDGGHWFWNGDDWKWSEDLRDPDGDWDCLTQPAVAKNIITVGSCLEIIDGYNSPADVVCSDFSAWGPTDDGRIKPDIVANGEWVCSCDSESDVSYNWRGGTSMAAPAVTGSAALLQEHYHNLNAKYMLAATLKGLIIHAADEAGPDNGPDYMFGWGKMNTEAAADLITYSNSIPEKAIWENKLKNNETEEITFYWNGIDDIKVTICWTDPAGTPVAAALDPGDPMLVNDLDIRLIRDNIETFYPWKLDKDNPGNAATQNGDNAVDNVEQIFIDDPAAGYYTLHISHKGNIGTGQDYSLIYSGLIWDTPNRWTGAFSDYWSNEINWSLGHVPLYYENVEITNDGNYPVQIDTQDAVCNNLTIESNATLNIKDQTLQVNGNVNISGTLMMSEESGILDVEGDIVWGNGSLIDVSVDNAQIFVCGNWEVNAGADVQMDQGYIEFNEDSPSQILLNSTDNLFNIVRINKQNSGSYVDVDADCSNDMNVLRNIYVYEDQVFRSSSSNNINMQGDFVNQDGFLELNSGKVVYEGSSHTLNLAENDYYCSIEINCSGNATLSSDLNINNDLIITSGTLNSNGYDVYVGGNWTNDVGDIGFLESTGNVIFNSNSSDQVCYGDTFNKLTIHKSDHELQFDGNSNCAEFDWQGGSMNFIGGTFSADDLTDNGIFGRWTLTSGATVNLSQDINNYIDLNGSLYFNGGGELNVYSSTPSYWGSENFAHVQMTGGVLYFNDDIIITTSFSTIMSGGCIQTDGIFENQSEYFLPTGGEVRLTGTSDAYIKMDDGYLHGLVIDKSSARSDDSKTKITSRKDKIGNLKDPSRSNSIYIQTDLDINGDFQLIQGTFDTNGHDMSVAGNWTNNAGESAFIEGTRTVTFDGDQDADILTNETFYNLYMNKTYSQYDALETGTDGIGKNITILNDLRLIAGSFELNDPTSVSVGKDVTILKGAALNADDVGTIEITVDGDWINNDSDGFEAGSSSEVIFCSSDPVSVHEVNEQQSFNDILINTDAAWFSPTQDVPIYCNNLHIQNGTLKIATYEVNVANELYIEDVLDMSSPEGLLYVNDITWEDGSCDNVSEGNMYVTGDWSFNSGVSVQFDAGNMVHFIGNADQSIICNESSAAFGSITIDKNASDDLVSLTADDFLNAGSIEVDSGTLELGEGSSVNMETGLNVNSSGRFVSEGSSDNEVAVSSSSGYYEFSMNSGSIIDAEYTIFSKMNTAGIKIKDGSTVYSLAHCSFQNGQSGGTLLTIDNNQILTILGADFVAGAAKDATYNVTKNTDQGSVTVANCTGSFAGPDYENDIHDRIDWSGFGPDLEITDVAWSQTSPCINNVITATVTVYNNGNRDIAVGQQVFVDFFYDTSEPPAHGNFGDEYSMNSDGIDAGDFVELVFDVSNSNIEAWNSYFLLDTDGVITEINEDNNVYGPDVINWVSLSLSLATLVAPGDGNVIPPESVLLDWAYSGASVTGYEVWFGTAAADDAVWIADVTKGDTSYNVGYLDESTAYEWYIKPYVEADNAAKKRKIEDNRGSKERTYPADPIVTWEFSTYDPTPSSPPALPPNGGDPLVFQMNGGIGNGGAGTMVTFDPPVSSGTGIVSVTPIDPASTDILNPESVLAVYDISGYNGEFPVHIVIEWEYPPPSGTENPLLLESTDGGTTFINVATDPGVTNVTWNLESSPYSVGFDTDHIAEWAIGNGVDNSLPVELHSFTAQYLQNTPTIYWSTQSETDNMGWLVYRNIEDDFSSAQCISDLVPGYGTTTQRHSYIYNDIDDVVVHHIYYYWLESIDYSGTVHHYNRMAQLTIPEINEPGNIIPPVLLEDCVYPNPFSAVTNASFYISESGFVELRIYNLKGQLVREFQKNFVSANETVSYTWNGKNENGKYVGDGMYFYVLCVNGKIYSEEKIILLR